MKTETITLRARFNGPPDSANGGYSAGAVAALLDPASAVEVTLRRPPPLERALEVRVDGDTASCYDGEALVADARVTPLDIALPAPVPFDTARAAMPSSPFLDMGRHPFPTCFTCGPLRDEGDGLRVFPGHVPGTEVFAAPWTPRDVDPRIVWAALDCPSCAPMYLGDEHPAPHVLGRIAARIVTLPEPGAPHVIVSSGLGRDGRKFAGATAIYAADGSCLAYARATWISVGGR